MSSKVLQPKIPEKDADDGKQRLRWFFACFLALWMLTAIIVSSLVLCTTKNPLYLSLFSSLLPPVYLCRRFATFLFPMSQEDKDYQLKLKNLELQMKILEWRQRDNEAVSKLIKHSPLPAAADNSESAGD